MSSDTGGKQAPQAALELYVICLLWGYYYIYDSRGKKAKHNNNSYLYYY